MLYDSGRTEVWWRDVVVQTILWCGMGVVYGVYLVKVVKKWGVSNNTLK